jgi:valyl-tRNA synthetase
MDLRVESLPSPMPPPAAISECDADGNGFASFDLQALVSDILDGAPITTVITFHETELDANNGSQILASPYTNINAFVQYLYVRAENTLTGCYRVITIELNVNLSPIIPSPAELPNLTACDEDNNNQNGFTTFDLTVQTPILIAAQTGPADNYSVRYYTSLADAEAGTAPIILESNYVNLVNPQTIWVRVNNILTDCYSIGTFQLIVGTPLALGISIPPLSLCDDGATTLIPQTVFDLTVKDNEITQNLSGYTVT